jgi:hypothetical protein
MLYLWLSSGVEPPFWVRLKGQKIALPTPLRLLREPAPHAPRAGWLRVGPGARVTYEGPLQASSKLSWQNPLVCAPGETLVVLGVERSEAESQRREEPPTLGTKESLGGERPDTEEAREIARAPSLSAQEQVSLAGLGLRARLALASRPDLSAPAWDLLAQSNEVRVLRALVENPGSSPSALRPLVPFFPREIWRNPALPLWRLEDPALSWVSNEGWAALRADSSAPAWAFDGLSERLHTIPRAQRLALACNPACPIELLRQNVFSGDAFWIQDALRVADFPISLLHELGGPAHAATRRALAGISALDESLRALLAKDPDPEIRALVASQVILPAPSRRR